MSEMSKCDTGNTSSFLQQQQVYSSNYKKKEILNIRSYIRAVPATNCGFISLQTQHSYHSSEKIKNKFQFFLGASSECSPV